MELIELIKIYSEYGVGVVLFVLLLIAVRYAFRRHEACTDDQKKIYAEHKDEIKGITIQMFDVVNRNTQSVTQFSETMKELGRR